MNLERYKEQMSERFPSGRFTEETLFNLKNGKSKSRVPLKAVAKGTGTAALLTAAAFTIVTGASFLRGFFSGAEDPAKTFDILLEEDPRLETEASEENRINENELYMTPLANPDHAVRVNTENGKVALNEDTTLEEMLACGAVLSQGYGPVGYEQLCGLFRAYRNGESAETVFTNVPIGLTNGNDNGQRYYRYVGLNEDGTVNGKEYFYRDRESYLQTAPFGRGSNAGEYKGLWIGNLMTQLDYPEANVHIEIDAGMALHFGSENVYYTICTISDLLRVTGYDEETLRERYYAFLSQASEFAGVNILYQGRLSAPKQLYYFLSQTKKEDVYCCSTTITDITKTDEYEECFYALEYIDGRFRIFTMKNGFEGEFDTQEFDGFTLEDGDLVFRNEAAEYRFPYDGNEMIGENAEIGYWQLRENTGGNYICSYYEQYEKNTVSIAVANNSVAIVVGKDTVPIAVGTHAGVRTTVQGKPYVTMMLRDAYVAYSYPSNTTHSKNYLYHPLLADRNYLAEWLSDPSNYFKILDEYSDGNMIAVEISNTQEYDQTIFYSTVADGTADVVWGKQPYLEFTAAPPTPSGKYRLLSGIKFSLPADECDIRETSDGKTYLLVPETFPQDDRLQSGYFYVRTLSINESGDAVRFNLEIEPHNLEEKAEEYLTAHPERVMSAQEKVEEYLADLPEQATSDE